MEDFSPNTESFDSLKNRIATLFESEGLSENVLSEINRWHDIQYQETNKKEDNIEKRVKFQMQLAELEIVTKQLDLAFNTLSDVWDQAAYSGLETLVREISDLMDHVNSLR